MDQVDLTYQQAWLYLCAVVSFYASILGVCLAYGETHVQLHGSAGLLLLIPMSATVVIWSVAYSAAARTLPWRNDLPFMAAWCLIGFWLMWCLALPAAWRRLRRGR
ncbi:MAG: hypothetical protein J2P30_02015 [Actinobacteria bacterium]|nr:hypothetical protein [Actinomycetota bacterium]